MLNQLKSMHNMKLMSQYHLVHFCIVYLSFNKYLVNSAPQNNSPILSTLNVQNPIASSIELASKEKKIQDKRFSDLKASFLNK